MIYNISQPLIDSAVQCWACPIFDKLFQLISKIVSSAYSTLTIVCVGVFVIIFALYAVNAVWNNLKSNSPDTWHTKSLQKVVINSLFALLLLMTGVTFPRIITTITAEPVAHMTLAYTQILTQQNPTSVEEAVSYTPEDMPDDKILFMAPLKYWRSLKPYQDISLVPQVKIPFCIAQGACDIQVTRDEDYAIWEKTACPLQNVTCKLYEDLNHLMMPTQGYKHAEEYEIPSRVSENFIQDLANFILK